MVLGPSPSRMRAASMAPLPATASGLGDSLIEGGRYRGHPPFAAVRARYCQTSGPTTDREAEIQGTGSDSRSTPVRLARAWALLTTWVRVARS